MTVVHLNWGACSDWAAVRSRLRFLRTTLKGNFAQCDGDVERIKARLIREGFVIEVDRTRKGEPLLRLSEPPAIRKDSDVT